jgi:hypothetical protein
MLGSSMNLVNTLEITSDPITNHEELEAGFKEIFRTEQARNAKHGVYFILSLRAFPRLNGESKILYIGSTQRTVYARYSGSAKSLSSSFNGDFYRFIIKNFGGIQWGFIAAEDPKKAEKKYFKEYCSEHFEFPPKSKVG